MYFCTLVSQRGQISVQETRSPELVEGHVLHIVFSNPSSLET